jgi:hypothetical protein
MANGVLSSYFEKEKAKGTKAGGVSPYSAPAEPTGGPAPMGGGSSPSAPKAAQGGGTGFVSFGQYFGGNAPAVQAQAQKAVATGAIERGAAFLGQLSAVKPDVIDKLDADESVDVYFDYIGMPPSIVVPDDKVAEIRQARAQEQQAAKQAEMAATMAPAMKQGAEAASVLASAQENAGGGSLLQTLGIA